MKNIHLIPTFKPSRLAILHDSKIHLGTKFKKDFNISPQNIYITSNEEIKEGDWIYYTLTSGYCKTTVSSKGLKQEGIPAKKIILTTDQDLIADGIEQISEDVVLKIVEHINSGKNIESFDEF